LIAPGAAADPGIALATAEAAQREILLTGCARARAELPLVAETAGRVDAVAYDIGDSVGDEGVLAQIDDTFIALELEHVEPERLQP
jgi:multidrug efflux pump subunit AcrA (membrane-fusion protein)